MRRVTIHIPPSSTASDVFCAFSFRTTSDSSTSEPFAAVEEWADDCTTSASSCATRRLSKSVAVSADLRS